MKKIIAIVFLFVTSVYSQTDLDSLIDVGNKYYNEGQKEKALRVWEDIISKANDSTATFGTTMQNIQWYYIEANNEKKLLEAYEKIKKSKVKDKALNNQIGKPFKNYRYYSTTNLATFFAKNKRYQKALKYANIADNDLVFYTTSLTSYIFQKVDLAFLKYRLYNDLGDNEKANFELIKRALEYNYHLMCKDWATRSQSNDELELAETILKNQDAKKFLEEMNGSIEQIEFKNDKTTVIYLSFRNQKYEINVFDVLKNKEECIRYLKESFLYKYLSRK